MAAAGRAFTVPENLSGYEGINLRRRSSEMQLVSGRNVVLNYGAVPPFDRSSKNTLIYFYLFLYHQCLLVTDRVAETRVSKVSWIGKWVFKRQVEQGFSSCFGKLWGENH